MAITMILPTNVSVSIYTSPTTEDDGYTYPDDASEGEKEIDGVAGSSRDIQ